MFLTNTKQKIQWVLHILSKNTLRYMQVWLKLNHNLSTCSIWNLFFFITCHTMDLKASFLILSVRSDPALTKQMDCKEKSERLTLEAKWMCMQWKWYFFQSYSVKSAYITFLPTSLSQSLSFSLLLQFSIDSILFGSHFTEFSKNLIIKSLKNVKLLIKLNIFSTVYFIWKLWNWVFL